MPLRSINGKLINKGGGIGASGDCCSCEQPPYHPCCDPIRFTDPFDAGCRMTTQQDCENGGGIFRADKDSCFDTGNDMVSVCSCYCGTIYQNVDDTVDPGTGTAPCGKTVTETGTNCFGDKYFAVVSPCSCSYFFVRQCAEMDFDLWGNTPHASCSCVEVVSFASACNVRDCYRSRQPFAEGEECWATFDACTYQWKYFRYRFDAASCAWIKYSSRTETSQPFCYDDFLAGNDYGCLGCPEPPTVATPDCPDTIQAAQCCIGNPFP